MAKVISAKSVRQVNASPDRVFATLTDLQNLPSWNHAMTRVVEIPPAQGPGAQWVVEFRAFGTSWLSRSTCETFDPEARRFEYRSGTDDGNPSYARWKWSVRGSGPTEVEVSWELHPVTLLRRVLLAKVRARQLKTKEVPASLAALARVVESSGVNR